MRKYRIQIVMRSGQTFNTTVKEPDLCYMLKNREFDFTQPFVVDSCSSDEPVFIINGNHIESITMAEVPE